MRIVTAQEAVAGIRSGDQLYLQCAAATPEVLLAALVARAPELRDVCVVHLHTEGPGPHLAPEMAGHFRHRALFIGPNARRAVNEGRADFVPVFLSDVPSPVHTGALPLDAVFDQRHAARLARVLLARDLGRGDARGDRRRDDGDRAAQPGHAAHARASRSSTSPRSTSAVEVDEPVHEVPRPVIGDVERRIGAYIADLVVDGATLQLGIGAIPAATAALPRRQA